ncbi:MAG: methionine--tRNA ligase [Candidatus Neomarinimicrobiota bacterium]
MAEKQKFYITTPIYYVNDRPHIGHAYTTILAYLLARYHRIAGTDTFFLTGLDEHGQKVQQAAAARGIAPQEHCDSMAPHFLELWDKLHIRYDDFIRTTEKRHHAVVQQVLQKVYDAGDIYHGEYGGFYCVGCERFYTEKELEDGNCPQHQKPLEYITEKNYYFRMGKYQQTLIDYIHANPEFIQPEHRKNEILGFLRQDLGDLCISRPKARMSWGIDLPFDNDYVTYVWFDALLNYITAPGYGADDEKFARWWPADYHLIGKDILTTHAVYWPTMLFSAGIPQPRTIFAHGWWLTGDAKMSKSLGNIVNPLDLIDRFGVDPVRYYLMREMVLGQDASFTPESFVKRYNSDLANDFGNLLSRVTKLINRNFGGVIPNPSNKNESHNDTLVMFAPNIIRNVNELVNRLRLNEAIEVTMQFVRGVNRYLEHTAPWKMVKEDKVTAGYCLYDAAESLRIAAVLLSPVMPNRTATVLETLGTVCYDLTWGGLEPGLKLQEHEPLFPRIDLKVPEPVQTQPPEVKMENVITIDDFAKVQLKTAEVIAAEKVEGADRLLKLQIKIGEEQRQIVAGIAQFYAPEALIGKIIVMVYNLQPVKLRGIESQGMLLAAKKGKELSLIVLDKPAVGSGASIS